jgi:hypothetical protein
MNKKRKIRFNIFDIEYIIKYLKKLSKSKIKGFYYLVSSIIITFILLQFDFGLIFFFF